jgi:CRP/FNR family transcriptional regulator, dissimilatory nitrate respiration regulator
MEHSPLEILEKCPLFNGLPMDRILDLLNGQYKISAYKFGDLVLAQGDEFNHLYIIKKGKVSAEMLDAMGRTTTIEELESSRIIAPAFLFASKNKVPVDVIARMETLIIRISKEKLMEMMQQELVILKNYLQIVANRAFFLSEKIRSFRFGTIKSKWANYLLEQAQIHNDTIFQIPHSQQDLADLFGVTRPAVAKALSQLIEIGVVQSDRKYFRIMNISLLQKIISEQ